MTETSDPPEELKYPKGGELQYPPPSSYGDDDIENEEIEEQIHLSNVIQTFEQYGPYAV